jgi:hypothetical protein
MKVLPRDLSRAAYGPHEPFGENVSAAMGNIGYARVSEDIDLR